MLNYDIQYKNEDTGILILWSMVSKIKPYCTLKNARALLHAV